MKHYWLRCLCAGFFAGLLLPGSLAAEFVTIYSPEGDIGYFIHDGYEGKVSRAFNLDVVPPGNCSRSLKITTQQASTGDYWRVFDGTSSSWGPNGDSSDQLNWPIEIQLYIAPEEAVQMAAADTPSDLYLIALEFRFGNSNGDATGGLSAYQSLRLRRSFFQTYADSMVQARPDRTGQWLFLSIQRTNGTFNELKVATEPGQYSVVPAVEYRFASSGTVNWAAMGVKRVEASGRSPRDWSFHLGRITFGNFNPDEEPYHLWKVQPYHGKPTLMHNADPMQPESLSPVNPVFFYHNGYDPVRMNDGLLSTIHQAGFQCYTMDLSLNWGDNTYGALVERVNDVLALNPNAKILMRLYLWAPAVWAASYPDEIMQLEDGTPYSGFGFAATSYASQVWINEVLSKMDQAVTFLRTNDLYDSVIGVLLCAGGTGEWNGFFYPPYHLADYSPAMQHYYHDFLEDRYGSIGALNAAYGSSYCAFGEVPIPSDTTMRNAGVSWFRGNSTTVRRVEDYLLAHSAAVNDAMLTFAARFKQLTKNQRLVGTWWGQHMQAGYGGSWGCFKNGYLLERDIITSDLIDFVMTPPLYISTYLNGSAMLQHFPSVWNMHNKLSLYEMDQPSHMLWQLYPDNNDWVSGAIKSTYYGDPPYTYRRIPESLQESLAVYTRAAGYSIIQGAGIQYWDIEGRLHPEQTDGVSYNHPEIIDRMAALSAAASDAVELPRDSIAEVAVIFDPCAYRWTRPLSSDYFVDVVMRGYPAEWAVDSQLENLAHAGLPYDIVELQDFAELRPYKLYVFLNTWALTSEQLAMIHNTLDQHDALAVWFYAAGYVNPDNGALSTAAIQNVTGFQVATASAAQVRMIQTANAAALGILPYSLVSRSVPDPRFIISDIAGTTPIGQDPDTGAVLAAIKTMPGGWSSVYSAAAPLPTTLWAEIAQLAGCHIYTAPGYVVQANASFLLVHGTSQGVVEVHLPQPMKVYNAVTRLLLAENTTQLSLPQSGIFTELLMMHEVTPPGCGDPGFAYLPADVNQDCYVNLLDLTAFASYWLQCNDPADSQCLTP